MTTKTAFAKNDLATRAKLLANAMRAASPKPGRYSDGRNLYLNVASTGAKSWVFVWFDKTQGRQRELGLGSFTGAGSVVSLTIHAARSAADATRAQIAAGVDPIQAKIEAKVAAVTFADMLALTIERTQAKWKVGVDGERAQVADWNAKMANHAAALLPMQVGRLTRQHFVDCVAGIYHDKQTTADRVMDIFEAVMEVAIHEHAFKGANPAKVEDMLKSLGARVKADKVAQPSLAFAKVPAAIAALLADGRMGAKASVFCTLTATRTDEARLMRHSEVDEATRTWTIPAIRMKVKNKNDRAGSHVVPLSDAAWAVYVSIAKVPGNDYVFTGTKAGQPVHATALNDMVAKGRDRGGLLSLAGEACQHGMRASFRTWGGELELNRDALELSLAHTIGSDTERSYNRASMLERRAQIMQAWGNHCMGVVVDNVVQLRAAA